MGKIARVVLVLAQVVVSIIGIFVGASVLPDLVTAEGGDEIARGQRAMAILGSLFSGVTILIGAFAIDMFYQPFMTMNSILATLLAALVIPFLIYLPLDRHISRLEDERAGAASKNTTES
jgi:ABC-type enterochelin transport system permease subunit